MSSSSHLLNSLATIETMIYMIWVSLADSEYYIQKKNKCKQKYKKSINKNV